MAKKKFGVSSTLNKNSKVEEPVLPPKRPLSRTKKNIEAVKEKVDAIHESALNTQQETDLKTKDEVGKEKESPTDVPVNMKDKDSINIVNQSYTNNDNPIVIQEEKKPKSTTKRKYTKKEPSLPKPERIVRITVDTPRSMHVKLKIKAIENDITIRDYIIGLIKADLGM